MRRRTPTAVVFALLLVCVAAFLGFFVPRSMAFHGPASLSTSYDLISYFLPRFVLGSEEVLAGRLPLWNPYEYGGLPFLATAQPAVFYPPKILTFGFLPMKAAYWTFLGIHYVAVVATFLLFLRDQRIRGIPALIGTAVWTFATPMATTMFSPIRIACLVWVPVCFLFVHRLARGEGRHNFVGLAIAVMFQLFAGYPEMTIDTGLLVAVVAVASHVTGAWAKPPWRTVPVFAAAFGLGGLLAAVQLVPLGEIAVAAQRSTMADATERLLDSVDVLGAFTGFVSVFPAFMVFVAIGCVQKRGVPAAVGFLTCVAIAAGGWRLLRLLPGLHWIRFPWVWVFLAPFFMAWASAAGSAALLERDFGRSERRASVIVAASGLLRWTGICAYFVPMLFTEPLPILDGWSVKGWQRLVYTIRTPMGAAFGFVGASLLAVVLLASWRARSLRWREGALAGAWIVTLGHVAGYPYALTPATPERPHETGVVRALHGPRPLEGRAFSYLDVLWGYNLTDRVPSLFGAELSFLPRRYHRLTEALEYMAVFKPVPWERIAAARGFLDAFNLQYLAVPHSDARDLSRHGLTPVRATERGVLFENPDRMGPAWVNYAVHRLRSERAVREYVLGSEFDPHREVVLESPTKRFFPSEGRGADRVRGVHRVSDTDVTFDVDLDRPGILVVSESSYPGWKATVDGRPTEWVRANYVLRAVELGPGKHRVRFVYRSWAVRMGLFASALGVALTTALLLRGPLGRLLRKLEQRITRWNSRSTKQLQS